LFIEHASFKIPLELAYNGEEFIGQKYSVGNWLENFGRREKKTKELYSGSERKTLKTLFLGDMAHESEDLNRLFSWRAKESLCEVLTSTWSDSLVNKLNTNDFSILHFTCHGSFDEANPDRSFLILDQDRSGESETAILRSSQLKNLKLHYTPLVFLNACHSGKVAKNYLGFVGFADSLFQSGAATFITTLWSVSDRSALHFAKAFYENLLAGEPVGRALQKARLKCWLEKNDTLTSLAYILFGDPHLKMNVDSDKQDLEARTDPLPSSE
jgi:CHAT domain-containing protein